MTVGFKELLRTASPLVLVTLANSFLRLADRYFLGAYSQSALAAVSPAFVLTGVFSCFSLSVVSYSGTFVAHDFGRARHFAAVKALGQGLWLTIFAIPLVLLSIPAGNLVISSLGHAADLMRAETTYFDIVMAAQIFTTFTAALSSYFTAERNARLVGFASVAGCLVNLILDPLLIFGFSPLPALGIAGAAAAATAGMATTALLLVRVLVNRRLFAGSLRKLLAFKRPLFLRILHFALPNSVRKLLEIAVFYLFICATAATDETTLAVSNICLCVNSLYFAAFDGTSTAVAALVSRARGADDDEALARLPLQAFRLLAIPFAVLSLVYLVFGGTIATLFANAAADLAAYATIGGSIFAVLVLNDFCESAQNVFGAALLGVGDTRFSLKCSVLVHLLVWTPLLVLILFFHPSIVCCYLSSAVSRGLHALILFLRWHSGKWREIHLT